MRLFQLPTQLCIGERPSLAVLTERQNNLCVRWQAWLGEGIGSEAPSVYSLLGNGVGFAKRGVLVSDYPADTETVDLKRGAIVRLTGVDTTLEEQTLFGALSNKLLMFIGDEILSVGEWRLVAHSMYSIKLIRGRFDTPISAHSAGDDVYILPLLSVVALTASSFEAGNTSYIKVLAAAPNRLADLSEVEPATITFTGTEYFNL